MSPSTATEMQIDQEIRWFHGDSCCRVWVTIGDFSLPLCMSFLLAFVGIRLQSFPVSLLVQGSEDMKSCELQSRGVIFTFQFDSESILRFYWWLLNLILHMSAASTRASFGSSLSDPKLRFTSTGERAFCHQDPSTRERALYSLFTFTCLLLSFILFFNSILW